MYSIKKAKMMPNNCDKSDKNMLKINEIVAK